MAFFRKFSLKNFGEKKKDMPEGQWQQCPKCKAMLHEIELTANLRVCPKCAHHQPLDSAAIDSVEVKRRGDVRAGKLYYLRNLTGKKARIKEDLSMHTKTKAQ